MALGPRSACCLSSASRAKHHAGSGPSAQTLGVTGGAVEARSSSSKPASLHGVVFTKRVKKSMPNDQSQSESAREQEWKSLYARLALALSTHGRGDPFGDGDFFLIDDDYGTYQHKVECTSAAFFQSGALADTQELLSQYDLPWQVVFVLTRSAGGPAACTVTREGIVDGANFTEE